MPEPRGLKNIKEISIGVGVVIDSTVEFIDVQRLSIGDQSYIGPNTRIIGGEFRTGDYSKIHNHGYIYSKNYVRLGHCAWVGQGSHLDGTGGIEAGHFLGVGINSALYSHVRHGDITEGCCYERNSRLVIGDDVWFVGMCLVAPVIAKSKSLAMLGSVITTDMDFNHVYGGNPARDLTAALGPPWNPPSPQEKMERFKKLLAEYYAQNQDVEKDRFVATESDHFPDDDRTYYNPVTRKYSKRNSSAEVLLNKWLFGYRAKFIPQE